MSRSPASRGRPIGSRGAKAPGAVDRAEEFWQCFSTFTGRSPAALRALQGPLTAPASGLNFPAALGLSPSHDKTFRS